MDAWWGEPGLTPAERVYASNVFNILAFTTGTPGQARERHPAQSRRQLPAALRRRHQHRRHHAGAAAPSRRAGLQDGQGRAAARRQRRPLRRHADRARPSLGAVRRRTRCSARPTPSRAMLPATGGSICNDVFTDILGMPTIWIPHSYASCSQHAPDEHILMPVTRSAIALMAAGSTGISARARHPRRQRCDRTGLAGDRAPTSITRSALDRRFLLVASWWRIRPTAGDSDDDAEQKRRIFATPLFHVKQQLFSFRAKPPAARRSMPCAAARPGP